MPFPHICEIFLLPLVSLASAIAVRGVWAFNVVKVTKYSTQTKTIDLSISINISQRIVSTIELSIYTD